MIDLRDPQQFERAYRDLAPGARSAAARVLDDHAAAEDVVQDVFMDLWERPQAYDPRRGPLELLRLDGRAGAGDRPLALGAGAGAGGGPLDRRMHPRRAATRARPRARCAASARARCCARSTGIPREQREALLLTGTGLAQHEIAQRHAARRSGTVKGRVRLGLRKARTALVAG